MSGARFRSLATSTSFAANRAVRYVFAAILSVAAALPVGAQGSANGDTEDAPRVARSRAAEPDISTVLGMSVSSSGTERDTLGLLISSVVAGGPADRAGVDEGNRLAAINGVSLRVDGESVGARGAGEGTVRRLSRELASLQSGDDVTLRLFGAGRFRTVTLHPVVAIPPRAVPPRAVTSAASRADATDQPATLAGVADGVTALQAQLRKLEQGEGDTAMLDSLTQLEQDLGAIRRRVRDLQGSSARPAARASANASLPGISLSAVADELVPYFGEGSESGLLVLKADESWDPIRPGDIILRINGAAATVERLRTARQSRRGAEVEVIRRKRNVVLTLDPAE